MRRTRRLADFWRPMAAWAGALASLTAIVACAPPASYAPAPPQLELSAPAPARGTAMSAPDAVRLAEQATFGPTMGLVDEMTRGTAAAWVEAQFAATGSSYADLVINRAQPAQPCATLSGEAGAACRRDYQSSVPVAMRFYANALSAPDQLRQRVAYALSDLFAMSEGDMASTAAIASYQQLLLDHAFGNYRDLLRAVALHPVTGAQLDLARNRARAPSEKFARALLETLAVSPSELTLGGSIRMDGQGRPIPAYSERDIREIARALTGWTFAARDGAAAGDQMAPDLTRAMVPDPAPDAFDAGAKSFLGRLAPPGAGPQENLDIAVDAVFNHPNLGPYLARALIQRLVTANPSPDYVARVASAFNNDGMNQRGEMKALVRAILLDPEARGEARFGGVAGKVKEPVLLMTGLMRLAEATTDGFVFVLRDDALGQQPFHNSMVGSVSGWDFPLPGSGGALASPQSQTLSDATIHARHNLVFDWTISGDAARGEFQPNAALPDTHGTQPNWSAWEALASVDAILDRIDLLAMNRTMTPYQRAAIRNAMLAITDPDPRAQMRRRAQVALYVVTSSALYQVDR